MGYTQEDDAVVKLVNLFKEIRADNKRIAEERLKKQGEKKKMGRPKAEIEDQDLLELREEGYSYRKIADLLGFSHMTVARRLRELQKQRSSKK